MASKETHVVPHQGGGWEVIVSGRDKSSVHATQREAQDRARELTRKNGGEVVVHARDGRIRDSETITAVNGRDRSSSRPRSA